VQTDVKPVDEGGIWSVGMNTGTRRILWMHTPEKQIKNTAEMSIVLVIPNSSAKKTVQGQGVNECLEMVLVGVHACLQKFLPVLWRVETKMIGFIINNEISALVTKYQVDEPLHQAVQTPPGFRQDPAARFRQNFVEALHTDMFQGKKKTELIDAVLVDELIEATARR